MPVVLSVRCNEIIVGIRNDQSPVGERAANGYGKEQVLIVDEAIAIVIEIRAVLDELDAPSLKYP